MSTTGYLGIPLVAGLQQTPEVTHNEGLYLLQALLNGVIDRGRNAPPSTPTEGDAYIVGAAPTGTWANRANAVAIYTSGGWRFVPGNDSNGAPLAMGAAQKGLHVVLQSSTGSPTALTLAIWNGSAWKEMFPTLE